MTAVEESPILIPSEDEEDDDDDIVVVKEEKIPITIDETEDADQDGEVIFVAQTSAPSPSTWGRTAEESSGLQLIADKETTEAAAAITATHCSTDLSAIAGVSTAISPSPCSADLSSIEDVSDDLGEGHESKPTLQRNLSLASAVDFSLSLEDTDQSPLDLSKNSSADGKTGASVGLTVLGSHHRAGPFVSGVDRSTYDSSSSGIRYDRVGAASTNPAVLVSGDSQGGLHSAVASDVQMLASPFAIPSSSQAVISTGCSQVGPLGVVDSSATPGVLVNADLKVAVQDQKSSPGTLNVADVLMDFSAASTSSQMVGGSNLTPVRSAESVKLSAAASSSTDTNTQLLVDFLMQDDQLSQVLVPTTTCSGSSLNSSLGQSSSTAVPSAVPSQPAVPCPTSPYLQQSSTSVNSAVIQTKSHFMNATKLEDLSGGRNGGQGLCVPGVRVLVGSPTLGFQQQPSSSSSGGSVSSPLDFAQIIAQVLDQQADPSSSGSSVPASSVMSSSPSLSSASASSAVLSSLSSSVPSSSAASVRTLYSSSLPQDPGNDSGNPSATTVVCPAPISIKRNSTNSLSSLDNSSLPPRKRVRSLILDTSSSGSSIAQSSALGAKSASFGGMSTTTSVGVTPCVSVEPASTAASSSTTVLPRPEDGGACERCQNSIIGTQLSRCTQGHRACGLCLEEQVKLVLTGRQKGSLKCITSNCSSYYPMSELKHSLPNMVVEILEDKLDRDYVEYISDMMLSNVTSNASTSSTATTTTTTTAASATPPPSTSKSTAEVQTSDNSDIEDNTDDNDADDSDNDSDDSTTSSSELSSSTTASHVTVKRKVAAAKVKKLLPKSSSSSLSSLASDDAVLTGTKTPVDLDDDEDDNMTGDDDVYDDVTDDCDDIMQRGGTKGRGEGRSGGGSYHNCDERQRDFPDNWVKMDNTTTLLAVPLKPDSEEYIEVAIRFHTTMTFPQADITKILRIQNPIMWKYYSLKRLEMVQENDGLSVEEKMLFHGTKCSVIDAICRKGFDWRVCGKHGTAYGHGCYFARDSIYSHNYTDRTTEASQASVVLRSVSTSSGSQSECEGASPSTTHLTPASVNLSSLNPQPSGSSHHHSKYHPVNQGVMGGRWVGRNLPSSSSSSHFAVHPSGPSAGGGSGAAPVGGGSSAGSGYNKSHLWSQRQVLRKILARMNPVMYQPSGGRLQGMGPHPAYHKPAQPPKPILPKPVYQPPTSIPSPMMGGHPTSSGQVASSHQSGAMGPARPPASPSSAPPASGPSSSKPKIVSVMVGPYSLPKPPPPPPPPSSAPQPMPGPGIGQQGAGSSGGLVPSFTGSLSGGGVMVGGPGSAAGPAPGPPGFAMGPLSSAHRNSLLFLSQQPPITPPHLLSHPMGPMAHTHQQPPAPTSQLPPWVRLPTGPPPPHGIVEPGKYSSGSRYMFLAKVLVGRSTGGCSGYRRPPPLDQNEPFGKCYDSCVDNIFDPKIFVIFDSNQAYPEYIVEYKFVE